MFIDKINKCNRPSKGTICGQLLKQVIVTNKNPFSNKKTGNRGDKNEY